jgi:NADP-dependent 3-hydroxy acid dehydrogenase YdfG
VSGLERWRGKVALVTGASSGIGEAVARRLSAAGLKVALLARRRERLEALAAELTPALVLPCDLRDEAQLLAAFARVRQEWGGVDVLVNNAGLGRRAPLLSGASEDWREMLDVNVLALCVATREAVADMRRQDLGHVIHISSMSAHRVPGGSGVYSATKFAVRSLTEGLRQELRELGSAVRVSAISPGFVETEFAATYNRDPAAGAVTYGKYKVLESVDVAETVAHVLAAPPHVQIHDVLLRPTDQPS